MTDSLNDVCPPAPTAGPPRTSNPIAAPVDPPTAQVSRLHLPISDLSMDRQPDAVANTPASSDDAGTTVAAHPLYASFCPRFHRGIELIGKRWTGAIVRAMLGGAARFSDIAAAVPGLSDRLLSERLRELEAAGVIARTVIPAIPVRVEYALTESGRALDPVIDAVAHWAETWVD